MKNKKNTIMLISVIIMSLVILTWDKSYSYEMKDNLPVEQEIERKEFGIYLEITQNSQKNDSDYTTTDKFPTKGYLLDKDKTECYEYGSNNKVENAVTQSLTKGVIDGSIIVTTNKSMYCKIYFDKDDNKPTIKTFELTGNKENDTTLSDNKKYTHISTVNYTLTWDDNDVSQICVKEDNGECTETDWKQIEETSKNDSITISNTEGEKTINAYLKDKANNVSKLESKNITLDTINPTITLTQGSVTENSITVNVTAEDTNGISSVTCKAEGNSTIVDGEYSDTDKTCTFNELESGTEYTITGEAIDGSGRISNSSSINITTDKKGITGSDLITGSNKPKGLLTELFGDMYRFNGACNAGNNNGTGCNDIVDNFVCFGYNDSKADCVKNTENGVNLNNDYIYRIIGITEDGKMKLIKNTQIKENGGSEFIWYGSTQNEIYWNNSEIFKRLNGISNGSKSGSSGNTNLFIDSSTTGISYLKSKGSEEDMKWYNKIENHVWKNGRLYNESSEFDQNEWTAEKVYGIESSFDRVVTAKIGLMYVSDIYYSYTLPGLTPSKSFCGGRINATCGPSWLVPSNNGAYGYREWVMTTSGLIPPYFVTDEWRYGGLLIMEGSGSLSSADYDDDWIVRPVFYLNQSVKIESGRGTSSEPFIIEK